MYRPVPIATVLSLFLLAAPAVAEPSAIATVARQTDEMPTEKIDALQARFEAKLAGMLEAKLAERLAERIDTTTARLEWRATGTMVAQPSGAPAPPAAPAP